MSTILPGRITPTVLSALQSRFNLLTINDYSETSDTDEKLIKIIFTDENFTPYAITFSALLIDDEEAIAPLIESALQGS